ncbi:hypothetical protein C8R47DRAFT_530030 [Mycena vitilis]|nr:hypothetical protein C8R47DRAFT_530030 [Mycena vitilis]
MTSSQPWAPPRHPLPPHRLARLANALGVSTPMPAIHTPSPLPSPSYPGPALDPYRRSPTPSTASFNSQPTSKYLLHVIPPLSLPHDNSSFDSELTPPPSTASGYHTQFRRGTLVPVHPTLQSQLAAIAKEYALPSTTGLILYLVSQSTEKDLDDEPGPRLSEDIWRHLWTRVVKSELRDELATRSTPYLPQYPVPLLSASPQPGALHPHAHAYSYPVTPSPTTPSSTSEHVRGMSFGNPPSSSGHGSVDAPSPDADADTPATSRTPSLPLDTPLDLPLPGLHSPALIPILAKVEFDVDRRRAGWYEPWVRSRRMNHAKRAASASASRSASRARAGEREEGSGSGSGERDDLLAFRLGKDKDRASALRDERYIPLSESPCQMDSADSDAESDYDVGERPGNPQVVQLAEGDSPIEENRASIPARRRAPVPAPLVLHPSSSPAMGVPRVVPPPESTDADEDTDAREDEDPASSEDEGVDLAHDLTSREQRSPTGEEAASARLAYLDADGEHDMTMLSVPRKSVYDLGKRRGTVYEDMDLGFGGDIDMDDPNDRRKSQVIMRAQLDEIEKVGFECLWRFLPFPTVYRLPFTVPAHFFTARKMVPGGGRGRWMAALSKIRRDARAALKNQSAHTHTRRRTRFSSSKARSNLTRARARRCAIGQRTPSHGTNSDAELKPAPRKPTPPRNRRAHLVEHASLSPSPYVPRSPLNVLTYTLII